MIINFPPKSLHLGTCLSITWYYTPWHTSAVFYAESLLIYFYPKRFPAFFFLPFSLFFFFGNSLSLSSNTQARANTSTDNRFVTRLYKNYPRTTGQLQFMGLFRRDHTVDTIFISQTITTAQLLRFNGTVAYGRTSYNNTIVHHTPSHTVTPSRTILADTSAGTGAARGHDGDRTWPAWTWRRVRRGASVRGVIAVLRHLVGARTDRTGTAVGLRAKATDRRADDAVVAARPRGQDRRRGQHGTPQTGTERNIKLKKKKKETRGGRKKNRRRENIETWRVRLCRSSLFFFFNSCLPEKLFFYRPLRSFRSKHDVTLTSAVFFRSVGGYCSPRSSPCTTRDNIPVRSWPSVGNLATCSLRTVQTQINVTVSC